MNKGMIKVSVLYPNNETGNFDMGYYCNTHIPMVKELLGDALKNATVEKGLGGGAPGSSATYIAMGNMYYNSIEEFQTAFGPHAKQIMGDLPNFTNIEPVIQISEVLI
ncbi:MAG: EthD family reductase [Vicingaceae bacterium]|nr:EthD family reductase [Vicingaceae bacterium]